MADAFLGQGLQFPMAVDRDGALALVSGEAKVRESVLLILNTIQGERQMRPTFGSSLHEQVFGPIRPVTISKLKFNVQEALIAWEPRIEVLDVTVSDEQAASGVLLVSVNYSVRATNTRFNLVFPFFIAGSVT
jgi:phage baseplate assembly protein W